MKRLNNLDILRAYGIIFMVLGHTFTFFGVFDRYIHTFHMPLFFVVSGYLFHSKKEIPVYRLVVQKAKRLLLPYVTFAIINYVVWFFKVRTDQEWYNPIIKLITYNTSDLPICGALWFLTALFWTEVIYILLDRLFCISWIRSIVVFSIAVVTCFIQNSVSFRLPLTMDIGIVCLGFYEIGRLYRMYGEKIDSKIKSFNNFSQLCIVIMLLSANLILAFVNEYVNIKSGWYGYVPLFWLNAIMGIFAYYLLANLIDLKFTQNNVIKKSLIFIGKGSIIYMGFNQLFILIFKDLLKIVSNIWIQSILVFGIVMCILSLVYILINKIKWKILRIFFGV